MIYRTDGIRTTRRSVLLGGAALLAAPSILRAQGGPIRFATLTPLTWMIAGALLGHAEILAARRRRIAPDQVVPTKVEQARTIL